MRRAVYAGSFDPISNGHLWMIEQGISLFDELIIAIGVNPAKKCTFSLKERLKAIDDSVWIEFSSAAEDMRIDSFKNEFLVNYAQSMKADYILRGVRSVEDYEFERGIRHINGDLQPNVTTIFLMPPREISEVSSSLVKGLIGPNGWQDVVSRYVPTPVYELILSKQ